MQELIFVEHSHGDMEGTVYDNIILNDGLLPLKAVNGTNQKTLDLKEGDKVRVTFVAKGSKTLVPKLTITEIVKVK